MYYNNIIILCIDVLSSDFDGNRKTHGILRIIFLLFPFKFIITFLFEFYSKLFFTSMIYHSLLI